MDNLQFQHIESINFWDNPPKDHPFVRKTYLQQITGYLGNTLVKVLVGQRRCGKSTLLKQVIQHLLKQNVDARNILFLNFELHETQFIKTDNTLIDVITTYFKNKKPQGKSFIFLDEIQEVEAWEKVVTSFLANERYDIEFFITGSNAHLLSTELSTYLTGRYIEITIYPFSFTEYAQYYKMDITRASLIHYLENSGMPELFLLPERQQKIAYLSALKDSILMNDIVKRSQIKNPKLLILLLDFMINNMGKMFSINAIANKLKSTGISVNIVTLTNYIHFLELTFLIHAARRYDLRGKKILEGERKYYLNDLGFSNYFQTAFDNNITRRLENFVYLTLLQAGYQVSVGNLYQSEIDFVAEKENQIIYIQVTYLLHSKEVIAREYGNLEKIKDNWPKWVVTLDEVTFSPNNGILHIPAWELAEVLI